MISGMKKNFTLLELLAAVCIIAILIAMVSGITGMVNRKNAEAETVAVIKALDTAFAMHKAKYGYVPCVDSGTNVVNGVTLRNGTPYYTYVRLSNDINDHIWEFLDYTYIKKHSDNSGSFFIVKDGFGKKILYKVPGFYKRNTWDIVSAGEQRTLMGYGRNGLKDYAQNLSEIPEVNPAVPDNTDAWETCVHLYFNQLSYINNFGY